MSLETIEIVKGARAGVELRAAMIVLHGLGADGNDFVPLCDELDLGAVGPVRFVFPHAAVRPVTINGGYAMRAWYDIVGMGPGSREDEAGLHGSRAEVDALIAREVARGVPVSRIVLAGFSQGCAMTLLTGLRHPERLAGLVGLSGYLPLAGQTEVERSAANRDVPVFLAHGSVDNVIDIARAHATRQALEALGLSVEWHEYRMAHSVCPEEIADLNAFLLRVLG